MEHFEAEAFSTKIENKGRQGRKLWEGWDEKEGDQKREWGLAVQTSELEPKEVGSRDLGLCGEEASFASTSCCIISGSHFTVLSLLPEMEVT